MKVNQVAVIAIFSSHIEGYPPSLNALFHLAASFDHVYILNRNVLKSEWTYPANVTMIESGPFIHPQEIKNLSLVKKFGSLVSFGRQLKNLLKQYMPSLVIAYDPSSFVLLHLFSAGVLRKITSVVWYHNHDLLLESELPRFSFMRLVRKLELLYFKRCTYFSLPTRSRMQYFPVNELKNELVILPNFPSRFFFGNWQNNTPSQGKLKLVFQGHVNRTNSIHAIVPILQHKINGLVPELHVAGEISTEYKNELLEIARSIGVSHQLFIYGRIPYANLPDLTASCHIGLTIYGNHNVTVKTIGTAGNKTFEYASVGLPVIYEKRDDLESEFASFKWITFSSLDFDSLLKTLVTITGNYAYYSEEAKRDFLYELNFETNFEPFLAKIMNDVAKLQPLTTKRITGILMSF
jgi:hypothetical protein